jgi:hypothetical protein
VGPGLPGQGGATAAQLDFDVCIPIRHVIAQKSRVASGSNAAGEKDIFQDIRDTHERAPLSPGREVLVCAMGVFQRPVPGDGDDCGKLRIEALDPIEAVANQIFGTDPSGPESSAGSSYR